MGERVLGLLQLLFDAPGEPRAWGPFLEALGAAISPDVAVVTVMERAAPEPAAVMSGSGLQRVAPGRLPRRGDAGPRIEYLPARTVFVLPRLASLGKSAREPPPGGTHLNFNTPGGGKDETPSDAPSDVRPAGASVAPCRLVGGLAGGPVPHRLGEWRRREHQHHRAAVFLHPRRRARRRDDPGRGGRRGRGRRVYRTLPSRILANGKPVANQLFTFGLSKGNRIYRETFLWDTKGAAPGEYRIKADYFLWEDSSPFDNEMAVTQPLILVPAGAPFPAGKPAGGTATEKDPRWKGERVGG